MYAVLKHIHYKEFRRSVFECDVHRVLCKYTQALYMHLFLSIIKRIKRKRTPINYIDLQASELGEIRIGIILKPSPRDFV